MLEKRGFVSLMRRGSEASESQDWWGQRGGWVGRPGLEGLLSPSCPVPSAVDSNLRLLWPERELSTSPQHQRQPLTAATCSVKRFTKEVFGRGKFTLSEAAELSSGCSQRSKLKAATAFL